MPKSIDYRYLTTLPAILRIVALVSFDIFITQLLQLVVFFLFQIQMTHIV